jgi:hypothetical protein
MGTGTTSMRPAGDKYGGSLVGRKSWQAGGLFVKQTKYDRSAAQYFFGSNRSSPLFQVWRLELRLVEAKLLVLTPRCA